MYVAYFGAKGTIDIKITSRPRTNDICKWSIYKNDWRKIDPDAANLNHSISMLIKNYDAHGFHFLLILQYQSCYYANCTEKYECISFPPLRFFDTFNWMFQNVCFFSTFLGVDFNYLHWQLLWQTRSETVFGRHHKSQPLARLCTLKWLQCIWIR